MEAITVPLMEEAMALVDQVMAETAGGLAVTEEDSGIAVSEDEAEAKVAAEE